MGSKIEVYVLKPKKAINSHNAMVKTRQNQKGVKIISIFE